MSRSVMGLPSNFTAVVISHQLSSPRPMMASRWAGSSSSAHSVVKFCAYRSVVTCVGTASARPRVTTLTGAASSPGTLP